jgi:RNA polymerase sigma-70 factor (ECF subfamily)
VKVTDQLSANEALEMLCAELAPLVHDLVREVVHDPTETDVVTAQVMAEVSRTGVLLDPEPGATRARVVGLAHRHALARISTRDANLGYQWSRPEQ